MQLLIKNEINLETIVTVDNNTMPQREVNRNFLSSYTTLPSYNFFLGFNACRKKWDDNTARKKSLERSMGKTTEGASTFLHIFPCFSERLITRISNLRFQLPQSYQKLTKWKRLPKLAVWIFCMGPMDIHCVIGVTTNDNNKFFRFYETSCV